jgi:hypothetical protein
MIEMAKVRKKEFDKVLQDQEEAREGLERNMKLDIQ